MNPTAHPLTVAAELSWKQESLGHANLAGHHREPGRARHGWHLPRALRRTNRRGSAPRPTPRPTHRPRPV
jgi:hypothetical protein